MAVGLLLGAVVFYFFPPQSPWAQQLEASCWRLGAILLVLWVAYPDVRRMPAWFWLMLPLVIAVLVFRPKWFVILLPVLIAIALLKPKRPAK